MLKIAIVDDDSYSIRKCTNILNTLTEYEIEIIPYDSGEKFLNSILKNELFDIVILDIDMPNPNGFQLAEKIRETYDNIIIIFYTSHEQYVYQSFEFQPFRYIRKMYAERELPFAVKQAIIIIKKIHRKNKPFIIDDLNITVFPQKILCFETNGRHCDIYLENNAVLNTSLSFKAILEKVDNNDFFVVHKGIAVNLKYVKSYTNQDITLENNMKMIISRRNINDFRIALIKYLGGEK